MSEIENKVTGEPTSSGEYYIEELVGRRCRVSKFEKWYETYDRDGGELMLFNTLDLKAAWNAAIESIEAIPLRAMFDEGYDRGYRDGRLRKEVQGE